MRDVMPTVIRIERSARASDVARFVAPVQPLGRVGSALAFTTVLVVVQLVMLAGHATLDVCRIAGGSCHFPMQAIIGGLPLESPFHSASHAPAASHHRTSTPGNPAHAQGPLVIQTVAFRAPTRPHRASSPETGRKQAQHPRGATRVNAARPAKSTKTAKTRAPERAAPPKHRRDVSERRPRRSRAR